MTSSIKSRLFIWFILASVIPMLVIGGISYYLIFNKITQLNEENITNINKGIYNMVDTQQKVLSIWLESAALSFSDKLNNLGGSSFDNEQMVDIGSHRLPTWYIGEQKITGDFTLVDNLIEKEKLPATIFQFHNNKFIRVSTNVRQADGSRIVGTLIDSGPVYDRLINGQQYLGRANVEGIWHATIYVPIWDTNGKLIGAFVLGRKEQEYEMINAIKNIVVGETGYVFVMDPSGNAIIHPTRQGENLQKYHWAQEILHKKNGSVTYDFNGQEKIAYYTYYEPWQWYIVTGAYVSEIFNTTGKLAQTLMIAFLIVIGISALIAYILSNTFSKPIKELMTVIREAQSGNLLVRLNHYYNDEFRFLSSAFNTMLNNISLLIGRIIGTSTKLKEASQRLIIDLEESDKSLQGIENGVENLKNNTPGYIFKTTNHNNDEFQDTISKLRLLVEQSLMNNNYDNLEEIIHTLNKIEDLSNKLTISIKSKSNISPLPTQHLSYINKINNLDVEVQKLKLLLKNICSSAAVLDDVALSLDRHVKVFKIEENAMPNGNK